MIAKYFSDDEFRCPCCGFLYVDQDLLNGLDMMREKLQAPIRLSSACRCVAHNKKVGGAQKSYHLTTNDQPCRAVDIKAKTGLEKYLILKYALELGFGGIGVYKAHIHIDVGNREAVWIG